MLVIADLPPPPPADAIGSTVIVRVQSNSLNRPAARFIRREGGAGTGLKAAGGRGEPQAVAVV